MKQFNKIQVLLATVLMLSGSTLYAQVFWTETYSDQATANANWKHSGTNGGTQVWTWTNNPAAGFQTPTNLIPAFGAATASTGYFLFDSDANGNFAHDVRLTGPAINCTGKTSVKLTFSTQFAFADTTSHPYIGVSTDGVNFVYKSVFTGLAVNSLFQGNVEVALPEADNKATVYLQFRWKGVYQYHWKIDDLSLNATPAVLTCAQNPNAIICDNFETYTAGALSPQATFWAPWSGAENSVLSAVVTTEKASQGTKSMRTKYATSGTLQGTDQLLLLGNKSTGRYELKWKMYIPSGKAGYYNIQNSETAGQQWNLDVFLDSNAVARVVVNPTVANQPANATFTFPRDQWFTLTHYFDLDNNIAKMFIDGNIIYGWAYTGNIGSIDYYSLNTWDQYYVDEVEYVSLSPLTFNPDNCATAVDLTQYFGQSPNIPQVTSLFDNSNATPSITDPSISCWGDGGAGVDKLDNTMWFTFNGDGKTYHIETTKCNATNYIGSALPDIQGFNPDGDTQMAVFSGDCGNGTLVDCNDDYYNDGVPDWRAGVDLVTEPGKVYYMLVDGFNYGNNQVATGQFCLEITQVPSILCANGKVGTYSVDNNGFVCSGTNLADYITLLDTSFVLPTVGPVYGLSWAVTSAPVPAGTWPPSMGSSYISSTGFINAPFAVGINNTVTNASLLYVTPVVVAGATVTTQADPLRMENVSVAGSDACFFVGQSSQIVLVPALPALSGTGTVTPANNGAANNGKIDLTPAGGLGELIGDPVNFYDFNWSNGGNTQDLTGLTPGTYTVTISDLTNCTDPVQVSFTVTQVTGAQDPAIVKSLQLTPNPTHDQVMLNLELQNASEVRVEVVNAMGQAVQTLYPGTVHAVNQAISLGQWPSGVYMLRITLDGQSAVRSIVLQK